MELKLSQGVENIRQIIRWLGKEHLRPLGIEADRSGAPLPADHPFFVDVLKLGWTGGFIGKMDKRETDDKDDSTKKKPSGAARRAVVLAEEAAYWDRGMATTLPGPSLGGAPIMIMGSPEQKERFLGIFNDKEQPRWGAFGMTEPGAGSDVAALRTSARLDGDHWVLNGEKCFISNGGRASWVVVWATIDPELGRAGHRAFVVERGTPGFQVARIDKKMGLTASETATLVFEDCRVPTGNLLGAENKSEKPKGFKGAMQTFNMTRPIVAAMAVGVGRAAHDEALRFAREAFDGASAHRIFRVRARFAQIRRKLEAGRLLAWRAAWLADMRQPNATEASIAKAYCPPVALEAASLGLEILGEAGGASDALIEKLYRDVKVLDIVEGTGQIQKMVIARHELGYRRDGASNREKSP